MRLSSAPGRFITLGAEFARGGEGTIHSIDGEERLAAKIYLKPPDPARVRKLQAMVALPSEARPDAAAWPIAILMQDRHVRGFLMPRVRSRREIHDLFSPAARREHFPSADYRFLVRAAENLSRAVASIHAAGAVVGDLNERAALVDQQATMVMIDCDSMQFKDGDAILHCDVGVPSYQPPENQGKAFRGLRRSRNHDAFALGVLIFQLLFFGRHPFSGRPVSGDTPELTDAIRNHQFAWARDAPRRGLVAPPNTLPLQAAGEELAKLFERTFGPCGETKGRPTAGSWMRALDRLGGSLRRCPNNPMHWSAAAGCAICSIEAQVRTQLFIPRPEPDVACNPGASVARMRRLLDALPKLPALDAVPKSADWYGRLMPTSPLAGSPRPSVLARALGALGMGTASAWMAERQRLTAALETAKAAYGHALELWNSDPDRRRIEASLAELARSVADVEEFASRLERKLTELLDASRSDQLRTHLERFHLRDAQIEGIGVERKRTLAGSGIDTAADLTAASLRSLPGFGDVLIERLLRWRQEKERWFVFDPSRPPDRRAANAIKAEINTKLRAIEAEFGHRAEALQALLVHALGRWPAERARLAELARAVAQAELNSDLMK
jgi:DNA-binding helix-hairpin-helix protein with protein kinase domain